MEIIDSNKIVIDIYKYDELVSQLTQLRMELEYCRKDNENFKNLLAEKDKIIEMLTDVIKRGKDEN